ncbi:MAG: hypothetical protein ABR599_05805 [Gemmatimonadota bacterium]
MPSPLRLLALTVALLATGCDDTDGGFAGAGDLRLIVTTRSPDAVWLFDAQTLRLALDTPTSLPAPPLEARAGIEAGLFVVSFQDGDARAFDTPLFQEVANGELPEGEGRSVFDPDEQRIWLADESLRGFDSRDLSPLGFPPVDLDGEATDILHDAGTGRLFVLVTGEGGPHLRVFSAANLAEVPPSPLELPGGGRSADLLGVPERGEILAALPSAGLLAGFDARTLRELARTPIEIGIPGAALARDAELERIYVGAPDGTVIAVEGTSFALRGGFPRRVADSIADLGVDPVTEQLFVADSAAGEVRVLDSQTLQEVADSPLRLDGLPVSVEPVDLRGN